jgi:lipoprotein-anchoring transpeptidase ErfK/SrfK
MEANLDPSSDPHAMRRARRSAIPQRKTHRGRWVLVGLLVLLLVVGIDLPLAYASNGHAVQQARSLNLVLARDQQEGVPASALVPLHHQLAQVRSESWWSPGYWLQTPQATLDSVRQAGASAWSQAMAKGRHQADAYLTEYSSFVAQNSVWLTASAPAASSSWPAELARAATPARVRHLALLWRAELKAAQAAANSSVAATAATVTLDASSTSLVDQAAAAEKLASTDGLSALAVPADVTALQLALSKAEPGTAQSTALSNQLEALKAEIGLQQRITNLNHTVLGLVDQASFEQAANAASFQVQYSASNAAFQAAQTVSGLGSAQANLLNLQTKVVAALAADQCGHNSIAGKSIYVSISLEEMIFYDNGCVVNATPVTTGRPQLPTPTGTFSIFLKEGPVEFISGYPPSSPYYYAPVMIRYAMEFLSGGYFIHNAPWEATDDYGPGSQYDNVIASHGCVHTPLATMAWAYSWTPVGTPVVITA